MQPLVQPKHLLWLSLNTAWLVAHSPYLSLKLRHLRDIAERVRHPSAMDRRRVSADFCFKPLHTTVYIQ